MIEAYPHLVFEAHSTDYQTPDAYHQLVRDHFAILKVGPALTFALREALFALAAIEEELVVAKACSGLRQVLEETMLDRPDFWRSHYQGSPNECRLARGYSYPIAFATTGPTAGSMTVTPGCWPTWPPNPFPCHCSASTCRCNTARCARARCRPGFTTSFSIRCRRCCANTRRPAAPSPPATPG